MLRYLPAASGRLASPLSRPLLCSFCSCSGPAAQPAVCRLLDRPTRQCRLTQPPGQRQNLSQSRAAAPTAHFPTHPVCTGIVRHSFSRPLCPSGPRHHTADRAEKGGSPRTGQAQVAELDGQLGPAVSGSRILTSEINRAHVTECELMGVTSHLVLKFCLRTGRISI